MRLLRHRLPPWRRIKTPPVDFVVPPAEPPFPSWLTRPPHYSETPTYWVKSDLVSPASSIPLGPFYYASLFRPPVYHSKTNTHFVGLDKRQPWIVDPAPVPDSAWFTRPVTKVSTDVNWVKSAAFPSGATPIGELQVSALFRPKTYQYKTTTHFTGLDMRVDWSVAPRTEEPFTAYWTPTRYYSKFNTRKLVSPVLPVAEPPLSPFAATLKRDIYRSEFDSKSVTPTPIPWAQPDLEFPLSALVSPEAYYSDIQTKTITPIPIPWAVPFVAPPQVATLKPITYKSSFESDFIQVTPLPFLGTPTVPPSADIVTRPVVYRTETKVKHITNPIMPWLGSEWTLFSFPDEGNFNANSIIHPHWQIYFLQPGTTVASPVYADSNAALKHASPVKVDRFGNVPTIYVNESLDYKVSIRNEFDVERHVIESIDSGTGIEYITTGTNIITSGDQVIRGQGTMTVTLNSAPVDEEFVVVIHDGGVGDTITVSDGVGTDLITVPETVVRYTYVSQFGYWVRGL